MSAQRREAATDASPGGRSLEQTMELFATCVQDGDLGRLMTLYEPDAILQPSNGGVFSGQEAIRGYLAQLLALKPTMTMVPADALLTEDLALIVNDWTMRGTAPDGSAVERSGRSADALRR